MEPSVESDFCPTWSHSHSVLNKHTEVYTFVDRDFHPADLTAKKLPQNTEVYINYKLVGLLAQDS